MWWKLVNAVARVCVCVHFARMLCVISIIVSPSCRSRLMLLLVCLFVCLFLPSTLDSHWIFGYGQFFDTCQCAHIAADARYFPLLFCQYTNELLLAIFLVSFKHCTSILNIYMWRINCDSVWILSVLCIDFSMLMKVPSSSRQSKGIIHSFNMHKLI